MEKSLKRWTVYAHINKINKKVYIGITSLSLRKRFNNGLGYKRCTLFWRAIKKYGWDNFEHKILYTNLLEEEACNKEQELIAYYHSNNPKYGYNLALGGEGTKGVHPSEETIEKMRKSEKCPMLGKHHSEESKRLMSIAKKGKKLSKEHCKKFSEIRKGANNPKAKSVYCIELHKTFEYIKLAAEELKISDTHISACCKGKRKTAGGYHWTYAKKKER